MTSKGIRRKKSTLSEVKIAVIGAPLVGKSALTVRFLTKRYIGEYDHKSETRYKQEVLVDGEPVLFEVLDVCPMSIHDPPSVETLEWADGLLLVYSITDKKSLTFIKKVASQLSELKNTPQLYFVANKADMVHLRKVHRKEGESLSDDYDSLFEEVAASEDVEKVAEVFTDLCKLVLLTRRKSKQSLLDRMLGTKVPVARAYARGKSDSALPKD